MTVPAPSHAHQTPHGHPAGVFPLSRSTAGFLAERLTAGVAAGVEPAPLGLLAAAILEFGPDLAVWAQRGSSAGIGATLGLTDHQARRLLPALVKAGLLRRRAIVPIGQTKPRVRYLPTTLAAR